MGIPVYIYTILSYYYCTTYDRLLSSGVMSRLEVHKQYKNIYGLKPKKSRKVSAKLIHDYTS